MKKENIPAAISVFIIISAISALLYLSLNRPEPAYVNLQKVNNNIEDKIQQDYISLESSKEESEKQKSISAMELYLSEKDLSICDLYKNIQKISSISTKLTESKFSDYTQEFYDYQSALNVELQNNYLQEKGISREKFEEAISLAWGYCK